MTTHATFLIKENVPNKSGSEIRPFVAYQKTSRGSRELGGFQTRELAEAAVAEWKVIAAGEDEPKWNIAG